MDVSVTPIAERIARVLAAERISANGEGAEESAAAHIDSAWRDHLPEAVAVLRTLREPDETMAAVGDVAVWERMVRAAIEASKPPTVVL
ncbi:hypothetical protein GCM10011380_10090 [Sphingomonas metalli]|jgi:hypothetical protein|uniref:Uncharacterized protein n=1 Tax=Sphingomonas metalli TaxID=1779358 RepID=A0A916WRD8_9SPHN|nr:hypothetical protein [Sphingomonas metalli]GGB22480.1 hypothetical protein GCM10011380_10090 [Sphingomonas metalli]